jgi:hypothetical protein
MMYQDRLAVALKVNGQILREFKDTVYIPFGSEYSLFIKNLNSLRCRVSIEIDGKDIADGDSFIVNGNSSIDIERFLRSGNMQRGNRFKFIERTAGVEAHRGGIQAEDGLIRIQFEFEREPVPIKTVYWPTYPQNVYYGSLQSRSMGDLYNVSANAASGSLSDTSLTSSASFSAEAGGGASASASADYVPTKSSVLRSKGIGGQGFVNQVKVEVEAKNDAGITAAGSVSDQRFTTVSDIIGDGVKHVMVLKLLGEVGQQKVEKAVTVSAKPKCTSCGKVNKATSRFCSECGTSLEII